MNTWTKKRTYPKSDHIEIVDERGTVIIDTDPSWGEYSRAVSDDISDQIVREHNAHEAVVTALKAAMEELVCRIRQDDYRQHLPVRSKKDVASGNAACRKIDAALVLLDGVEHHEFPKAESEASHE